MRIDPYVFLSITKVLEEIQKNPMTKSAIAIFDAFSLPIGPELSRLAQS